MRVALVSTYPPMKCAIGIYSQKLARALIASDPQISAIVLGEHGADAESSTQERLEVRPCYGRADDYRDAILAAALESHCDVVHFQHAPDLFGEDERLPSLVERLAAHGMKPVVTLHTVYDERRWKRLTLKRSTGSFHRALARHATIVVHHGAGAATRLEEQGVRAERVRVIPHGTSVAELPPRAEARARLGLVESAFYFTFFGFIHRLKNVHTIVEAFIRAGSGLTGARLLVTGMPWGDRWYNHLYVNAIRARAQASRVRERISIEARYLPSEDVPLLYSASDVVLLPHNQSYGSASGVFHQAAGFGRPVLCAASDKFLEAEALSLPELSVPPGDVGAWANAMRRMYADVALRERAERAIRELGRKTAWPKVAEMHRELYRELVTPIAAKSAEKQPDRQQRVTPEH